MVLFCTGYITMHVYTFWKGLWAKSASADCNMKLLRGISLPFWTVSLSCWNENNTKCHNCLLLFSFSILCVPCSWQGPSQDAQDICATYQLHVCSVMNYKVKNGYMHTRITCTVCPQKTFTSTKTNHSHPQKSHLVESIFLTAIETSLTSVESPWDDLLGHSVTQLLDMGSETSVTHTCWHINIVLLTCTQ